MYTHNLDPVLLDFGFIAIRWYSLAYIFGIILGWWFGKKIIVHISKSFELNRYLRGAVTANYTLYLENGASREAVYRMKGGK